MMNKNISLNVNGKNFIINARLYALIRQYCWDLVNSETDIFIVVDGKEGSGKSWGLRQLGYLFKLCLKKYANIETSFNNDNIHYTVEDYIEDDYKHADKIGHILIMDEAGDEIDRAGSTSKSNKRYVRFIKKARFRQHIHLLALPRAHELNKYIAISRTKIIINVNWKYIRDPNSPTTLSQEKGFFNVIDVEGDDSNKWAYYYNYNRFYQYPKATFTGKFSDFSPFSPKLLQELKQKKQKIAEKLDREEEENTKMSKKELCLYLWKIHPKATKTEISKMAGTSLSNVPDKADNEA